MSLLIEMHTIMVCEHGRPCRDDVASVFVVFGGGVGKSLGGYWSEPLCFFDYCTDVREIRFICECR